MRYVCTACGYVYDEEQGDPALGIPPGTKFEDLPEDFTCPWCGLGKEVFEEDQIELSRGKATFLLRMSFD